MLSANTKTTSRANVDQSVDRDANPEVFDFLQSIAMEKYLPKFTAGKIETQEQMLELRDVDLDALQIPLGYKLKILKKVKILRTSLGLGTQNRK